MKAFFLWVGAFVLVMGGLFLIGHLTRSAHPQRILVAVDTSSPMADGTTRPALERSLDALSRQRYALFSLATYRSLEHGWRANLQTRIREQLFYGPQDLSVLAATLNSGRFDEVAEADRIVVLTDARDDSSLASVRRLELIHLPQ